MAEARELSHVDQSGQANMVGVGGKTETLRNAKADGWVLVNQVAFDALRNNNAKKGDVIATARIAGLMAVKKASELIPLCHPLRVTGSSITFETVEPSKVPQTVLAQRPDAAAALHICASVDAFDRTGVEMEAMTALCVSALTIYDMLKAVDRAIITTNLSLLSKSGGKSGEWQREPQL
ncbi:MAG: cyclic pyranopterin monophosphate synthase MoaC [Planctomycetes bacterium]|nr:cyclic pyranopterin monophosphate synthase MoaC [Planctomycetota bacterium]